MRITTESTELTETLCGLCVLCGEKSLRDRCSAHEVENRHDDRNDDQNVNEPRGDVKRDQPEEPEDQQDDRNCEKHEYTSAPGLEQRRCPPLDQDRVTRFQRIHQNGHARVLAQRVARGVDVDQFLGTVNANGHLNALPVDAAP